MLMCSRSLLPKHCFLTSCHLMEKNSHSVVIMDNCIIHHGDEVVKMIHEMGALVHFLPPYSPDYAPVEEAFSKVKSELTAMESEAQVLDLETHTGSIFIHYSRGLSAMD